MPNRHPLYLLSLLAISAWAQEQNTTLEPIIVNVRAFDENSSEVPFTVHSTDGETIARRQLISVEEGIRNTPGVEIHSVADAGYSFMWIRGTGSLSHTSLDDNSVGIRFDGTSQGILGLSRNLFDIRQIDIGKGPQGTLYGHGAEAGIINISSNDPEPFLGADIEAGVGTNHLRQLKTVVNVPLGEQFSARVAGMSEWQDDYIRNRETGKGLNTQKNQGLRTKFLWQPNDNTSAMLTLYHDRVQNYLPLMLFTPFEEPPKEAVGTLPHHAKRTTDGINLDIRHDTASFHFDAQTRWHRHKGDVTRAAVPLDFLPIRYQQLQVPPSLQPMITEFYNQPSNNLQNQYDNVRQLEQEFRFTSLPDAPLQWVAGVYLQDRKRDFHYDSRRNLLPLPEPLPPLNADTYNADLYRHFKTQTQAVFGEVTYPLTDKLKTITGLRLEHEKIRYRTDWYPNPQNPLGQIGDQHDNQSLSDTSLTGRIGLDYTFMPGWHSYALYSRGHKSAGFSDFSSNIASGERDEPYKAGHIDAFELGIKGETERFGAGVALFHNKVSNDKISVPLLPSFILQTFNVDTRSQGAELSGYYHLTPDFTLQGSAAWIDTKVTHVDDIQQSITREGNRMPQVPRFSASLSGEYRKPIAMNILTNPEVVVRADAHYVGSRAAEPNNNLILPSHTLFDASLGISSAEGDITLWGKNLTDRKWMRYATQIAGVGSGSGIPAQGRAFGVAFKYHLP